MDGFCDIVYTQLVRRQLMDGIRMPPIHVLSYAMGLSAERRKIIGKTIIPVLQEASVVLDSEMAPDIRTDRIVKQNQIFAPTSCFYIDLTLASKGSCKDQQRTKTR